MLDTKKIYTHKHTHTDTDIHTKKRFKMIIERLYTVKEVAKILRVSERTIFRYMQLDAKHRIKAFKVGKSWRITESELNCFIGLQNKNTD